MSELIGFVQASADETQMASSLRTIWNGQSPFQHGVKFTISDSGFQKAKFFEFKTKQTSVSDRPRPVLKTSVGDLYLSSLNSVTDIDGKRHEVDGTLNKFISEVVSNPDVKNDGEILQKIVEFCKDKTFIVRRSEPFKKLTYTGRVTMTSLVNIDAVTD